MACCYTLKAGQLPGTTISAVASIFSYPYLAEASLNQASQTLPHRPSRQKKGDSLIMKTRISSRGGMGILVVVAVSTSFESGGFRLVGAHTHTPDDGFEYMPRTGAASSVFKADRGRVTAGDHLYVVGDGGGNVSLERVLLKGQRDEDDDEDDDDDGGESTITSSASNGGGGAAGGAGEDSDESEHCLFCSSRGPPSIENVLQCTHLLTFNLYTECYGLIVSASMSTVRDFSPYVKYASFLDVKVQCAYPDILHAGFCMECLIFAER